MKIKPKCFHFSWVFPVSVVLLCLFETLCVACQISFGPVSASSNMTTDHQLTCAVTLFFLRCRGNSWQQNVFAIEYPPDVLVARPAIWGLSVLLIVGFREVLATLHQSSTDEESVQAWRRTRYNGVRSTMPTTCPHPSCAQCVDGL